MKGKLLTLLTLALFALCRHRARVWSGNAGIGVAAAVDFCDLEVERKHFSMRRRRDAEKWVGRYSSIVNPKSLILLGITAVFIWLFFSLVDTPLRRPTLQADGILGKPIITPLDYAGAVRLLSYEAPTIPVAADDLIPLTLYFQAQREIGVPYNIGVQVRDGNGFRPFQKNNCPEK